MSWAFRRAATAMLITSATTSASFLANLVSPVPPIRVFGVFNGILIFANYAFVITWFPTVVVLHHRYAMGKRCCCCCARSAEETATAYQGTSVQSMEMKEMEDMTGPTNSETTPERTHPPEWRTVEKFCRTRYLRTLHRLRWVALAVLVVVVVAAVVVVGTRLRRATKVIQMMRSSHPMTIYTDLLARFPSSPHVPQDGMEVLVLMGLVASDLSCAVSSSVAHHRTGGSLRLSD
jgi:hypothetical protein